MGYRKISKIIPGAYIFQRPFLRGLSTEGNLRFKIDWASLIMEGDLPFFLYLKAISEYKPPRGAYWIWRGDLTEGFLRYEFREPTFWRGLYMVGLIFGILR